MENDLIQDTNLDLLQVQVASVEYSGQAPINVDNQQHIISLDKSALSSKLDTSAFNEWTATHTGTEYSAGDGIDITDHIISVTAQLTGDYLTKASADTLYQPIGDYLTTADSGNFYPMEGNPSGFLTGVDLSDYYKKNETSSKQEIGDVINEINNNITNLSGKYYPLTSNPSGYLTAHQDISDKLDVTAFTAYTATAVQGVEYSGIAPIDVNNNTHQISAVIWTLSAGNGLSLSEDALSKVTTISITGAAGRSYGINAEVVANSAMATGQNILYIVTGN